MPENLTKRFLVAVHRNLIETFGGSPGLRDGGGLEAALAARQATSGGAELYPTPAANAFLRLSGRELTPGDGPAFELVIEVARCARGVEGAARIIEAVLIPV